MKGRTANQILSQIKATQTHAENAASRRLAKLRGRKEETAETFPDFPHYMLDWKNRQERRGFRVVCIPAEKNGGERAIKVVCRDYEFTRTVQDFRNEYDRKVESLQARGLEVQQAPAC